MCSLCNTKTTSEQTLLAHADGKKHRAKARAFHAKQQPNDAAETKCTTENNAETVLSEKKDLVESGNQNSSKLSPVGDGSAVDNTVLESKKKRKLEACENGDAHHENGGNISTEVGNGKGAETEVTKGLKKAKHEVDKDIGKMKIKWKKLITSALKSVSINTKVSRFANLLF